MNETLFAFSAALEALKQGLCIWRTGWNGVQSGKVMYLELQEPDRHSKMTLPYIYLVTGDGKNNNLVPWLASQTDVLAEDWVISNKTPMQLEGVDA